MDMHFDHDSRYRDSEKSVPVSAPFHRNYRSRFFLEEDGQAYEVRDTLELPFEAPGFPRGNMIFEIIAGDKERFIRDLALREKSQDISIFVGRIERLEAPAEICRCRLFRIEVQNDCRSENYVEVWDTLEEPYEYRHALPSGELLCFAQDFSRRRVRHTINLERTNRGIVVVGSASKHNGI